MENVLVTGALGFLGENVSNALILKGYNVDYADLKSIKHKMDVASQDFLWKYSVLNDKEYNYIFHFASPCSILQFNEDPNYCVQNTLDSFRNVLRLSKYHHAKLIYPSSGNVYGELPLPHHEGLTPKPSNLYGVCKFQCEQMAIDHLFGGYETTGLRVYAGYGMGEEKKGVLASVVYQFLSKMIKGKSPEIWGDGTQTRDFIFINNIIYGFLKAMHTNASIINLGSGQLVSYNKLVDTINEVLCTNIRPIYKDKPTNYVESALADTTLMERTLEVIPWSLYDGINKFAEYLRWK